MTKQQREILVGKKGHPMTWSRYHRYGDMVRYMEFLVFAYPQLVELITIGRSNDGLPLKVIKVSTGTEFTSDGFPKPAFWIDGGMHGREWIAPSVVLYIVRQLVENYNKNKKLVNEADWFLMPVVNPDGYEYSHTSDRLWRKSRSNHQSDSDFPGRLFSKPCHGVDLNRNFDFHWGEAGSSDDPCHPMYAGPRPFSEPESKAVADFIMDHRDELVMYLTLHSYSQMWLVPWAYTNKKAPDYDDMALMARKAVDAMSKVGGTPYEVGTSASLLHATSGGSDDWAKGVAGIKYSYTVELRDKGTYGFLLPATHILPTAKEVFAAIKVMAKMMTCSNNVNN